MSKFPIKTVYYSSFDEDHVSARPKKSKKAGGKACRSRDKKKNKMPKVLYGKRVGFKYNFLRFILYRCLATPAAFIWSKLIKRERIFGREKLRSVHGGCFIYSNHTNAIGDAFSPNVVVFPRSADIIISRENFSVPVVGGALSYLGGIPTPETIRETGSFCGEVKRSVKSGRAVVIYPEAHLWQYMTKPRPLMEASFTYPTRLGAPVLALTRVYKKARRGFRCELYLDGPFYPSCELSVSEAAAELCERVGAAIAERCKLSDCEIIRYVKKDSEESDNK